MCDDRTFCTPHNEVKEGYTGIGMAVRPSVCPSERTSVCHWTQFCPELFSNSFARTALKFINKDCVSCACVIFMTILSLVVELSPLELVNFTELFLSREIFLQYCVRTIPTTSNVYWCSNSIENDFSYKAQSAKYADAV